MPTDDSRAADADHKPQGSEPAVPQEDPVSDDFYFEGALVVFTAAYHLRRGYCCGSDCRHCPYR